MKSPRRFEITMGTGGAKRRSESNAKRKKEWTAANGQAVAVAERALADSEWRGEGVEREADKRADEFLSKWTNEEVQSGGILLTGPPGTGKTRALERMLDKAKDDGKRIASVACAGHDGAERVLAALGEAQTSAAGRRNLRQRACKQEKLLLAVDEADVLSESDFWALRKVLMLMTRRNSRIAVAMAANRRNLFGSLAFELRELGCELQEAQFGAMTSEELKRVIKSRLSPLSSSWKGAVFDENALDLCCKKVAASYGDARRAISCALTALRKHSGIDGRVDMRAMHSALSERLQSPACGALQSLPREGKLLAKAAASLHRRNAASSPTLDALLEEYYRQSRSEGMTPTGSADAYSLCEALNEQGILYLGATSVACKRKRSSAGNCSRRVHLKVAPDVIDFALTAVGEV